MQPRFNGNSDLISGLLISTQDFNIHPEQDNFVRFIPSEGIGLLLGLCIIAAVRPAHATASLIELKFSRVAQVSGFSACRPYNNSNQLVSAGMNKGEVLAIAGKPDREESYYQGGLGRLIRISDWYYIRSGHDPETTMLKFVEDSL